MTSDRALGLEFLRGFLTLLVAYYHCATWGGLPYLPSWGLYGVYAFFAISGAALYRNYPGELDVLQFLWRRFTRLAPLFIVCVLLLNIVQGELGWNTLVTGSLLFGLFNPGAMSSYPGAWPLGIVCALYLLFPVCLALARDTRMLIGSFVALLILRMAAVEFTVSGNLLPEVWGDYIQVGNFLCFFVGGILVAKAGPRWGWPVAVPAAALLYLVPWGTHEGIILGLMGAALSLLCVLMVGGFYTAKGCKPFAWMGEASYGLYLIHPIVWLALGRIDMGPVERTVLTLSLSTVLGLASSRLFERPIRDRLSKLV
jgi:exopolysaccharide production protein ExoZ